MAGIRVRFIGIAVLMVAVGIFSACGDDKDVEVPPVKLADLARPAVGSAAYEQIDGEGSPKKDRSIPEVEAEQGGTGAVKGAEASREESKAAPEAEASKGGNELGVGDSGNGEEGDVVITISAAGDVTLGNYSEQDYFNSFRYTYDQTEDKAYFFENVNPIFSEDDMTIVNLEGMLTFSENKIPDQLFYLKGDPDYVYLMNYGSIEAVSMGNNHRLDYGEEATTDTVEALRKAGIVYAYDENVGIYETKGIRIGFVSVNEVYFGAGVEKTLQSGIEKLKEEGVDLILACCHWGTERVNYPEEYQTKLGRKCIDWGADLVIGHHPHVLQGVDRYQGKYIIYSLGNFCFGANRNPEDKDTMIFQQTFTFKNGVKQEDEDVRIIPCSVSSVSTRNDFKPTPAEGEEAARIIGRINEYSLEFGVAFSEDGSVKN